MIASPTSPKRIRNVAVLFADIQGCTRLCEDLPPREMNRVIERYFSRFLDVVRGEGGDVIEVLGDGLLALFEGPRLREDATRALAAAFKIQQAAAALNANEGKRHDPIVVHMGISIGPALVGMTRLRGRTGERHFNSVTGSVTNVAARLCALATRGQILINGTMGGWVAGTYRLRALGPRKLKNVSGMVEVFQVLPPKGKRGSDTSTAHRRRTNG